MGRLHRIHHGVYAVGHDDLDDRARCMAAVLACGRPHPSQLAALRRQGRRERVSPGGEGSEGVSAHDVWGGEGIWGGEGSERASSLDLWAGEGGEGVSVLDFWGAAVSHGSAAGLWGLLRWSQGPIDVAIGGDGGRARRAGIRLHRLVSLTPHEVTSLGRVPVTTPARTIADLRRAAGGAAGRRRRAGRRGGGSATVTPAEAQRAQRQAEVLGLPLGEEGGGRTRSDLEEDFLALCRRHRLPAPEVNVRVGVDRVDFLWHEQGLVVETDGYRYHRGRVAFEEDRERDLRLRAAGFDVLRISEAQLNGEPRRVAAAIRAALGVGDDGRTGTTSG